jgi:hypothetical protein
LERFDLTASTEREDKGLHSIVSRQNRADRESNQSLLRGESFTRPFGLQLNGDTDVYVVRTELLTNQRQIGEMFGVGRRLLPRRANCTLTMAMIAITPTTLFLKLTGRNMGATSAPHFHRESIGLTKISPRFLQPLFQPKTDCCCRFEISIVAKLDLNLQVIHSPSRFRNISLVYLKSKYNRNGKQRATCQIDGYSSVAVTV